MAAVSTFAVPVSVVTVTTPAAGSAFLRKVADDQEATVGNLERQRASRPKSNALERASENHDRGREKNDGNQTSHAESFHAHQGTRV